MSPPPLVSLAGVFDATVGGTAAGETVLRIVTATTGTLLLQNKTWSVTYASEPKSLHSTAPDGSLKLTATNHNLLAGTIGTSPVKLERAVLRPISPSELAQSDPGPTGALKAFFKTVPDYAKVVQDTSTFWYAFGPVLYRGRLDGTARLLCIASDPGPTECLPFVRRTLVGDSGQRVQGFLAKLGLSRSYVLVNAFAVALHPDQEAAGLKLLTTNGALKAWRNELLSRLLQQNSFEAIIAFGKNAELAYDLWRSAEPAATQVPVTKVDHPAAVDRTGSGDDQPLQRWAAAIPSLQAQVRPDPGFGPRPPNYGAYFTENDYARIPRWDLPKVSPAYVGDDSWARAGSPPQHNCCERPSPDDGVSLMLRPPPGQGQALRYEYKGGKLSKTLDMNGKHVKTDPYGIPV
ncbi:MAG TPA: hypothetical protein VMK12_27065 [Anaeromyxobacteraceae bacterium]|nr:hypothetical protein [Anaeromyxobacteraceae bacterium]